MKNFADSSSGASVLSTSKGVINKKSILESNPDSYLIIPGCHKNREDFVIINLADDVRIETIIVSNKEDFSARFSQIKFHASADYPADNWIDLGSI